MALSFKKILKNSTSPATDIEIDSAGITISIVEDYEIPPQEYTLFASEKVINELATYINAGDIIVNNGADDLSAGDGLRFLQYPDRLITKERNTEKVFVPESYDFDGNLSTSVSGGELTITSGGDAGSNNDDDLLGSMWQSDFGNNSSNSNTWLNNNHDSIRSNQSPVVAPWKSRLVGITFTNRNSGVDQDFKIYSVGELDTNTPKTKIFEWQIRNCRVARKTTFTADVILEAGDKFAIFMSDKGKNPNDVRITCFWRVITQTNEEVCKDFSGDLTLNGGGGTTT